MKKDWSQLEEYRLTTEKNSKMGTERGDHFGVFFIPFKKMGYFSLHLYFQIIASEPEGEIAWEHVSACVRSGHDSSYSEVPSWGSMCLIKDMFWGEEECVVQFHPPKSEYVNVHPSVLHLWKPVGENIKTPPIGAV